MTETERELEDILMKSGPRGLLQKLKDAKRYDWIGIYVTNGDNLILKLELGGTANHRVIKVGEGVCGMAAKERKTVVVEDVSKQPNYLACFPSTKSEIVTPIKRDNDVLGEIDVDSDSLNAFSLDDEKMLEEAANVLAKNWDKISF